MKILIVDDEQGMRKFLSLFLKAYGYKNCSTASNHKEAINNIKNKHFDVVITDMEMPEEGSGLKVAKAAKEKGVNVLAMSGNIEKYKKQLLKIGVAFLKKPFNKEEFFDEFLKLKS